MPRMNARQREYWYPLVERREELLNLPKPWNNFGPFCRACGRRVHKDKGNPHGFPQGNIDCIDNTGNHTSIDNLQLLCHACNTTKNATAEHDRTALLERSASEQKNADCEHRVRGWVISKAHEQPRVDTVVACAAELYGLSVVTVNRYLAKLTCPAGPLMIHAGRVVYRPEYDWDAAGVARP